MPDAPLSQEINLWVPTEFLVGVDLGQANDYTAVCVVQRNRLMPDPESPQSQGETYYQVRHLDRLPLGTPYPQQVAHVTDVAARLQKQRAEHSQHDFRSRKPSTPMLVVDQTGVGRPVVDMLRAAGLPGLLAVTITAGDATSREGNDYRVPKRELVSVLQVLLQTNRLVVAGGLKEADTLVKELLAFKVKISDKGHDSYGNDWRENPHDDMVLAVALAVWAGERIPRVSSRRNRRE